MLFSSIKFSICCCLKDATGSMGRKRAESVPVLTVYYLEAESRQAALTFTFGVESGNWGMV